MRYKGLGIPEEFFKKLRPGMSAEEVNSIYIDACVERGLADTRPRLTVEEVRAKLAVKWPGLLKKKPRTH